MSENRYVHYTCEFCDAEVIRKTEKDVENWICITNGSRTFDSSNPLIIAHMKPEFQYIDRNKIKHDLHFCCKECLVKWIYKRLGASKSEIEQVIKDLDKNKKDAEKEEKPVTRFNDLELVNNADE